MPVRQDIREGRVPVWIYTDDIEPEARQQLVNISRLPIVHSHVAAMPDVHLGIGATVGSVIPAKAAIIPAAVGVDIGCGMIAARLTLAGSEGRPTFTAWAHRKLHAASGGVPRLVGDQDAGGTGAFVRTLVEVARRWPAAASAK